MAEKKKSNEMNGLSYFSVFFYENLLERYYVHYCHDTPLTNKVTSNTAIDQREL